MFSTRSKTAVVFGIVILLGAVGGLLAALTTQPTYTARNQALITVSPSTDSIELNSGLTYAQSSAPTLARIGESSEVLSLVREGLPGDYAISSLEKSVTVASTSSDSLLDISASDPSPTRAAQIVDLVAQSLRTVATRLTTTNSKLKVSITPIGATLIPAGPSAPDRLADILIGATTGFVVSIAVWTISTRTRTKDANAK